MFCALDIDGSGLIDHAELVQGVSGTNFHELPQLMNSHELAHVALDPLTSAPGCAPCALKLLHPTPAYPE
jgi:hypothetical protein